MKIFYFHRLWFVISIILGLTAVMSIGGPRQLKESQLLGGCWECTRVGFGSCRDVIGMPEGCSGTIYVCYGFYGEDEDCLYTWTTNQDCAGEDPGCSDWAIPLGCINEYE